MTEIWTSVPGWVGLYEVSDEGRIRSLPRATLRGERGGRILKPVRDSRGYLTVTMSHQGKVSRAWIHQLVLEAFVGPRPRATEVAHENGDPQDNRLVNLFYKSKSANMKDSVRHGTHRNARKTKCPRCEGQYSTNGRGQRFCPACRNAYQRARYLIDPTQQLEAQRKYREEHLERRREIERESKRRRRAAQKELING